MNTKISEVENKIHDVSGLVKKTGYDAKILVIEKKYFTTFDYNKLTKKKKLDAKIKQKKLVDQSDISNFNNSDLNTKLATLATKAE